MRYLAPSRDALARSVFDQMPLRAWLAYGDWLQGENWPSVEALNERLPAAAGIRFVAQTRELLADGLHYEQRIAEAGLVATRECNWHDLFNALVWLRYPELKRALNARQCAEIGRMGPKIRSRAQYALTHFDEAGVLVELCDPALLALWDAHDWHGLFWRQRQAWMDGRIRVELFGHALLEHALTEGKLLVGKAVVFLGGQESTDLAAALADAIDAGSALRDPLELRPLPLSGIPGWHAQGDGEAFHLDNPSYQPLRIGRCYPSPLSC